MGQEANEDEKAVFGTFESGQYRKKTWPNKSGNM
jgi:hypothetical protein